MYSRQETMNVNSNQSIVVVGCGGVGFNVVLQLVMSGVNNIYVFDYDEIEEQSCRCHRFRSRHRRGDG